MKLLSQLRLVLVFLYCIVFIHGYAKKSPCEKDRQRVLDSSPSIHGKRVPLLGTFMPKCNEDGSYTEVQCNMFVGYCWCVDKNGKKRQETMARLKYPDCGKVGTFGGNANGADCVFPFKYNGTWHSKCTKLHHYKLWCATTVNYEKDKKWGNCIVEVDTFGGNAEGATCTFPFKYKDEWYRQCTKLNHEKLWCATTSDYDQDGKWGNCEMEVDTYGGNADGATCVFPFHYNGTWHAECTKRNHDRLWCSTTANYDIHHKWGNCVVGVETFGGNADGAKCVFPFNYKGIWHTRCTKAKHDLLWCATTERYDRDRRWGNCIIQGNWASLWRSFNRRHILRKAPMTGSKAAKKLS